jgi:hypothetical protein
MNISPEVDQWPAVTIEKVSDFEEFLEELTEKPTPSPPFWHRYYFRGQSDRNWTLEPSISRVLASRGGRELDLRECIFIELSALRSFRRRAHLHYDPSLLPSTEDVLAWWNLMQHHRAPTRLLDWSYSPYVALYFAVDRDFEVDGCVWYFNWTRLAAHAANLSERYDPRDHKALVEAMKQWEPEITRYPEPPLDRLEQSIRFEPREPRNRIFLYDGGHNSRGSQRIVAQRGTFTYCEDIRGDHAIAIREVLTGGAARDVDPALCGTIRIPASLKITIYRHLFEYNLDANSLFPGIDGLGQAVTGSVTLAAHWIMNERAKKGAETAT